MYYPDELVERVAEANDIVDIIGANVVLTRKGANYMGLCPFHNEKTPSFSVSRSKQIYKCFGCGKGGGVISFLMEYENMTFQEFCKLCGEAGNFAGPDLLYENDRLAPFLVRMGIGRNLRIDCLEENLFRYTNRYFYYNPKKSRIELHLPPAGNIKDTIEKTYQWFEENA